MAQSVRIGSDQENGQNTQEAANVANMLIEKIPDDVRKRFKSVCAWYDTTMRDELIMYMDAKGGNLSAVKNVILNLMNQLVDQTGAKVEKNMWIQIQHEFEKAAFPEVNDEDESIADAPIDHIPDDFSEYRRLRELEIEGAGRDVEMKDEERIEQEWERIEEWREEMRERHEAEHDES